jgi:translocation and assembly module TamA
MHINVTEAKHRSVGFGVGYATDLGAGVSAEWEHRNIRQMGERISVVANVWQIRQEGFIKYLVPDFLISHQDLIWRAEVEHEITKGFHEVSGSFSGIIERQMTDRLRISYGGMLTILNNTHSNNNRNFTLVKAPMQLMYNKSNSLLDPTKGWTIHLKTTPALQTLSPTFAYCSHILTGTAYFPVDCDERLVLAGKATYGCIWGASRNSIPPSERLYAGSDTLLRGYRYLTVSPLGEDHKPLGGRSMMVYSLEARWRIWESFGVVGFYDVGNVYASPFPHFRDGVLQSTGIGFRYHTPVGPLRLDIAFPLNRRSHLDNVLQVYFSIGQSF